jgi:hypothetical protein
MICEVCNEEVSDGLIHVPAELQPGREIVAPSLDNPGVYEPPSVPGCNAVTEQQLHTYLAAHCDNCGGALDPGMAHYPMTPGSCSLGPAQQIDQQPETTILTRWVG